MGNTCFLISRRRASAVPAYFLRAFGSPISRLGLFSSLDPPRRVAPFRDAASRPKLPFLSRPLTFFSLSFSSSFFFLSLSLRPLFVSIFPLLSSSRFFFSLYLLSCPASLNLLWAILLISRYDISLPSPRGLLPGTSVNERGCPPIRSVLFACERTFLLFTAPPSSADT